MGVELVSYPDTQRGIGGSENIHLQYSTGLVFLTTSTYSFTHHTYTNLLSTFQFTEAQLAA